MTTLKYYKCGCVALTFEIRESSLHETRFMFTTYQQGMKTKQLDELQLELRRPANHQTFQVHQPARSWIEEYITTHDFDPTPCVLPGHKCPLHSRHPSLDTSNPKNGDIEKDYAVDKLWYLFEMEQQFYKAQDRYRAFEEGSRRILLPGHDSNKISELKGRQQRLRDLIRCIDEMTMEFGKRKQPLVETEHIKALEKEFKKDLNWWLPKTPEPIASIISALAFQRETSKNLR